MGFECRSGAPRAAPPRSPEPPSTARASHDGCWLDGGTARPSGGSGAARIDVDDWVFSEFYVLRSCDLGLCSSSGVGFKLRGKLERDSSGLAAMDEKLDESVVVDVAPPSTPTWLHHWRRLLVVVVDVLYSTFALLDESVALGSLR
nr:hypothetical protein CFP56_39474 [Quercus suber]